MGKIIALVPHAALGRALLLAAFAGTALSPIARAADIVFNTDSGNVTVDGFSNSNIHGVNVGVTYSGGTPTFKVQGNFSLLSGAAGINGTTDVVTATGSGALKIDVGNNVYVQSGAGINLSGFTSGIAGAGGGAGGTPGAAGTSAGTIFGSFGGTGGAGSTPGYIAGVLNYPPAQSGGTGGNTIFSNPTGGSGGLGGSGAVGVGALWLAVVSRTDLPFVS